MAAAEARAAWQRASNRCIFQEDAKRGPKLACCSSSSSSGTQQPDPNNGAAEANGPNQIATHNFLPLNWNNLHSNLPPDTKWWLHLKPSVVHPKDYAFEQSKSPGDEMKPNGSGESPPAEKHDGKLLVDESRATEPKNVQRPLESPSIVSAAFTKKNYGDTRMVGMEKGNPNFQKSIEPKVDKGDCFLQDGELMDWSPSDGLPTEKLSSLDPEAPWSGEINSQPSWRISDQYELASLVAKKSQQYFENCDLPRPTQMVRVGADAFENLEHLDGNVPLSSPVHKKTFSGICDPKEFAMQSSSSVDMDEKCWSSYEVNRLVYEAEKVYSTSCEGNVRLKNPPEHRRSSDGVDPSRDELIEALCRSQTRAREAEAEARKAYKEKEHIVSLLLRQASHLFACKQWLHILQMETQNLQLKVREHQVLLPVLPWMPLKEKNTKRSKETKGKAKKRRWCGLCRCAVAFLVGLGLTGAGFLLGWTLGWLLPAS